MDHTPSDFDYDGPVKGVPLHLTTTGTRGDEIERLIATYGRELATPLMSEGAISPTQINRMGKAAYRKWQNDGQIKMALQARIRHLRMSTAELIAEAEAETARQIERERSVLVHRIEMWRDFGVSPKTGRMRPTYARRIADAEKALAAIA